MDRYNSVKVVLKRWEQSFYRENKRKPNKDDIDNAPEETKKLYKEYQTLKKGRESNNVDASACGDEVQTIEVQSSEKDADSWGSHLNRNNRPKAVLKLTHNERESMQASAQYFGMKLKSNLGDSLKERNISLKKSFAQRREPVKFLHSVSDPSVAPDTKVPQPRPANTCPNSSSPLPHSSRAEGVELPFDTGTEPPVHCLPTAAGTPGRLAERAQRLRRSVADRLSSVDSGWLKRCQVFDEVEVEEKPVAGNLPPPLREVTVPCGGASENTGPASPPGAPGPWADVGPPGEGPSKTGHRPLPPGAEFQDGHVMSPVGTTHSGASAHCSSLKAGVRGEDGETRRGLGVKEGGGREISPDRDARKSCPGARGGQEGGVPLVGHAEGSERKKRGKRQRVPQDDEEEPDGKDDGTAKSRKRTRKKSEDGVRARKKTNQSEHIGGAQEDRVGPGKTKQKPEIPEENLLGEAHEDVRSVSAHLKKPIKARTAKNTEGNFVKINLKKKSHVKGFALRGAALRKQLYMQKFQLKGERFGGGSGRGRGRFGGLSREGDSCYRCGGLGHWAWDCPGRAPALVTESSEAPVEEEPFELPTLEDVARATGTLRSELPAPHHCNEEDVEATNRAGDVLLNVIRPDYEKPTPPPPMTPFYDLGEDGTVQAVTPEVYEALADFGYKAFRPGQEVAIMRILSGRSTLVVLSTGMGKSLCYQLPAYLYAKRSKSIALVLSPLVSLMDDQLSGLPPKLKAACIHSNMSQKQREAAIEKVKAGQVHILLLSPEALVGGGYAGSACLPPADQLPPVAFACIDEAHCVSEWSHNFRPCYLRLCKVLRDRLGVRCLLGLTATATLSTALDIAHHLNITDQEGISVRSAAVPDNLQLSVSTDRNKDQALVSLMKGERFGSLDSIIVYCTRREETARVAALLRTCLQGATLSASSQIVREEAEENPVGKRKRALAMKKIRKPLKWIAESYHAGMSASERRRVQNNFMCGQLRLVVATVAFGMGLDKSDVRGIVHYNMPKSFESYVQEIGRAGRDGEPAHCHLFLDPEGGDLPELRRHIYANTVDHFTVKKLVQKVFPPCKCRQIHQHQQDLMRVPLGTAGEVDDMEMLNLMETCNPPLQEEHNAKVTGHEQKTAEGHQSSGLNGPHESSDQLQGGDTVPAGASDACPAERQKEEEHLEEQETGGGAKHTAVRRVCHTHERAIPIQETIESLDITEEGIETLLCYLELHPECWLELLHPTSSACRLVCYGGPQQLRGLLKICPPVAVVLARRRMAGERVEACDSLQFDVVELADTMGWELPLVKRGLRQLQWSTERGKSGVLVEFSSLSFHFRSYGDLTPDEMDGVCEFLHRRVLTQESTQLYQLKACFSAFRSVAYRNYDSCTDAVDENRSLKLKALLKDYFDKKMDPNLRKKFEDDEESEDDEDELSKYKIADWEDQIRADIRSFLSTRSDEKFSGRAVARVFHGIGSPCYPAQTFGRDRRYWRKYIRFDFNEIMRFATQEIIRIK